MNACCVFCVRLMFSLYVHIYLIFVFGLSPLCVYMTLHYVQEALSGRAHTTMLATISPSSNNYVETMNTLKYAERLRRASAHLNWNKDANGPPIGKVSTNTLENRQPHRRLHPRIRSQKAFRNTPMETH